MSEVFSQNYENIDNKEGIQEQNIPSFNDVENNIKQNYELNSTKEGAEDLALKQYKELQQLKKQKESPVLQETNEGLDKEAMINEAKTMLYEKLGIDENQNNNSSFENFEKGIVDELVLNNYDLAIQVWETNGKIILDGLSQLASWEGLKQIAEAIGESFMNLFTGNAYEKGKAVAELGLIGTGIGAGVYIGKKTVKLGIKQISKLRVNKERLVNSPDVKEVVGETNNKVAEIIPKKQLDFENAVVEDIAKLGDKDRIDAGKFYIQKDITPEQQQSIIKAHNVGKDRDGAGIYNYNQSEILEKSRILKDAGFSKGERKVLLEKGVCGNEIQKLGLLPDKYRFLKQDKYSNLLEELGDIDANQVVGEGVNALVINNVDDITQVRKISKIGRDDVIKELESHNRLYDVLEDLKDKKIIGDNIKIPEVFEAGNEVSFFMQKVPGHTPKSEFYLSLYKDTFIKKGILVDDLPGLSDQNINQFLKDNRLQRLPDPNDRFITPNEKRMEGLLQNWWDKEYKSEGFRDVRNALDEILKEGKIDIKDRNPGNFIITPDGDTYIIDFGQVSI